MLTQPYLGTTEMHLVTVVLQMSYHIIGPATESSLDYVLILNPPPLEAFESRGSLNKFLTKFT